MAFVKFILSSSFGHGSHHTLARRRERCHSNYRIIPGLIKDCKTSPGDWVPLLKKGVKEALVKAPKSKR